MAGQRRSLDDERGNLTLTYVNLIDHIDAIRRKHGRDPIISLYENVPGIYSTKDNAFGCLVGAICGQDAPVETETGKWPTTGVFWGQERRVGYRTLDAQFFGLAQRRRRCFLLAVPNQLVERVGDRACPSEILSVAESLRGDSPPSRETGKRPAPTISARTQGGGGLGTDFDLNGGLIASPVAPCLDASFARLQGASGQDLKHGHGHLVAFGGNNSTGAIDVATALNAHGGPHGRQDFESETFVTHSLRADGFDASEDGTGRGTPLIPVDRTYQQRLPGESSNDYWSRIYDYEQANGITPERLSGGEQWLTPYAIQERAVCENPDAGPDGAGFRTDGMAYTLEARTVPPAVAFSCKDYGADVGELSPTLRAMGHDGSHANAGGQVAVAIPIHDKATRHQGGGRPGGDGSSNGLGIGKAGDPMPTLDTGGNHAVAYDLRGREGGAMLEDPYDTANNRAASGGSSRRYVAAPMAVRRLTPEECEALQGFPRSYTAIPYRGKPAADGPRYKALGNSMAVPCMYWLGWRIDQATRLKAAE